MKTLKLLRVVTALLLVMTADTAWSQSNPAAQPGTRSFDQGWKFLKDNPTGAENPGFDDARWRALDLPHDWSIEDLPNQSPDSISGPFSRASLGKLHSGNTVGGTAWYRKRFVVDKAEQGKTAYLQFDGVYMNADVWVNGQHLGNHFYGYTSFWYNITPYLKPAGQPNVVAVQVKNEGLNSRWYTGSGIYRHTWLRFASPVHVAPWGVYVTTPTATAAQGTVAAVATIANTSAQAQQVACTLQLLDPAGKVVSKATRQALVPAGQSADVAQTLTVARPALWSPESPTLYRAEVTLRVGGQVQDQHTTPVGIRTIHADAQTGFSLNGKTMKLNGGCIHHDNGPLGAVALDRAEERKVELLKKAGFNALRLSHNPPSPYLLDACDRLGMLVIDESFDIWEKSKMRVMSSIFGPKGAPISDYSTVFKTDWQQDIKLMLLRDRNHPSIIMWSIGNEILEVATSPGLRIAQGLVSEMKKYDTTRIITEGFALSDDPKAGPGSPNEEAHYALLGATGYNYAYTKYEQDHARYPNRVIYSSEFMPPRALPNWQAAQKLPYVIGNFTWAAMDYMGESGVGLPRLVNANAPYSDTTAVSLANVSLFFSPKPWPMFQSFMGEYDLIGNAKPAAEYHRVVWGSQPVALFVHKPVPAGKKEIRSPWGFPDELKSWNWPGHEGEKMQVRVYTRSPLVKLELNGKVIGEQKLDVNESVTAFFYVPYAPGTLVARCYDKGVETASTTLQTVGPPAALRLSVDRATLRADRNDLAYVQVEVVDAAGNLVPTADDVLVQFAVRGAGTLAGAGSGSPVDVSSFQQPRKKSWQGRCLAIVRPQGPAGTIVLEATAAGLRPAMVALAVKK
ncbi:glycoside hydrolase family 2 TIM barrel-domain containing protein [Hymenobacter monticola]|uniref:DUF4982 domain-containing protein n=1 Tax=Hymenobacter monticola TaxID=1705399 RepID=A0ABY4BB62_9BACT|nr:glycoside hydrolase family 2 TIM barrel-domain containing protein [Hymenobacter monticola]UOE36394.1 DUF4982 domain-containing protein [Hymenobacter monticola]